MLDNTKDIIVALINSKSIANHSDANENIKEVRTAIKEIRQEILNTKLAEPDNNK